MNARDASADHRVILEQLQATPSGLPPKLFYDRLGSTLFTAICELPEYYPTRTESAIFRAAGRQLAARVPRGVTMIDLGAGDCRKAAGLFDALRPSTYVAVDIAGDFLDTAVSALRREYDHIAMQALVRDFTRAWSIPDDMLAAPLLYFYPGSSIGNFSPDAAQRFLTNLPRSKAGSTSLLIGIDRVKPAAQLEAAYDDALGVTAAFNRNALLHANRLLGTDFRIDQWSHLARFNEDASRIEMHLRAEQALVVRWPGGERAFERGETIHTESSYKYRPDSFARLLESGGFAVQEQFTDKNEWFSVVLARTAD